MVTMTPALRRCRNAAGIEECRIGGIAVVDFGRPILTPSVDDAPRHDQPRVGDAVLLQR